MSDRFVKAFRTIDDFGRGFRPYWEVRLLGKGALPAKKRGPQTGVADSETVTILVWCKSGCFHLWS
jgi:hypothetical protein